MLKIFKKPRKEIRIGLRKLILNGESNSIIVINFGLNGAVRGSRSQVFDTYSTALNAYEICIKVLEECERNSRLTVSVDFVKKCDYSILLM